MVFNMAGLFFLSAEVPSFSSTNFRSASAALSITHEPGQVGENSVIYSAI